MTFWLQDRRVMAGMNVNIWAQTETIKALVRCGRQVDVARLADSKIPLERVLAEARAGDG